MRGAGEDKDAFPGSRLPLRTHGAGITPGIQRAKAVARASPETVPAPKGARLSLDTLRHTRPLPPARRVRAGAAARPPSQPRHPRTHLSPVAPAAGSASARTSAGPAPVRSLLPAPPSPRPREVGLAAAPKSRSGPPELSRALPSSASRWPGCCHSALTSHAPQPEVAFCRQRWPPAPPVGSG